MQCILCRWSTDESGSCVEGFLFVAMRIFIGLYVVRAGLFGGTLTLRNNLNLLLILRKKLSCILTSDTINIRPFGISSITFCNSLLLH